MKRFSFPLVRLGLTSILLAGGIALDCQAQQGELAPVLQTCIDHHIMPGAVVLVTGKEKVLDVEAVGLSSLEAKTPIRPNSLFWIASMTKSFTGAALMMLVDEGKLSITDPVEKYLPEFKGQMVVEDGDKDHPHPPRHPITIKELLSHTSGLVLAGDPDLNKVFTLKERVAKAASKPLIREPGTKYEYNNTGINTAGRIIEVVSGQPYLDFLSQRLLIPLGMKDTTFWPDAEQAKRLVRTTRFTADKKGLEEVRFVASVPAAAIARLSEGMTIPQEILDDFGVGKIQDYLHRFAEPAGGLFSTAPDVGRFCQMLLNGGTLEGRRYLTEAAIRTMSSIQTEGIMVSPQEAYGLGWSIKLREDEGPSVGSFGHRGARRTAMWIDPKNQLATVLLVARQDMSGEQQKEMYTSVFKEVVAKFGKPR